jgi:hypothetical protein
VVAAVREQEPLALGLVSFYVFYLKLILMLSSSFVFSLQAAAVAMLVAMAVK